MSGAAPTKRPRLQILLEQLREVQQQMETANARYRTVKDTMAEAERGASSHCHFHLAFGSADWSIPIAELAGDDLGHYANQALSLLSGEIVHLWRVLHQITGEATAECEKIIATQAPPVMETPEE